MCKWMATQHRVATHTTFSLTLPHLKPQAQSPQSIKGVIDKASVESVEPPPVLSWRHDMSGPRLEWEGCLTNRYVGPLLETQALV